MHSFKLLTLIALILFASALGASRISAQEDPEVATTAEELSADDSNLEDGATTVVERGGLPEQLFTIYVHEDCPHCAKVEAFVDQYQINDQVEYIQLKNNKANMDALQAEWDKFNVSRDDQGWPFMVYVDQTGEESYAVGDEPIIKVLSQYNNIPYVEPVVDDGSNITSDGTDSSGDRIFLILGGAILAFIVGYGVYAAVSKK